MQTPESRERSIFVGGSTVRRRRVLVAGGTAAGAALMLTALALVSGFADTGPHHPPAWPDEGGTEQRNARPGQTPSPRAAKG